MPRHWYTASTGTHQGLICSEDDGASVAVTYRKEDAQLVAAAPAMLAALTAIDDALSVGDVRAARVACISAISDAIH